MTLQAKLIHFHSRKCIWICIEKMLVILSQPQSIKRTDAVYHGLIELCFCANMFTTIVLVFWCSEHQNDMYHDVVCVAQVTVLLKIHPNLSRECNRQQMIFRNLLSISFSISMILVFSWIANKAEFKTILESFLSVVWFFWLLNAQFMLRFRDTGFIWNI